MLKNNKKIPSHIAFGKEGEEKAQKYLINLGYSIITTNYIFKPKYGEIDIIIKKKEIIAFAKNGIGLSSETTIAIDAKESISLNATKIELGADSKEAILLGNAFKTWMENLILTLSTITPISPVGPCVPLAATPQWAGIESLKAQIEPLLLSEVAFTKKKAVV